MCISDIHFLMSVLHIFLMFIMSCLEHSTSLSNIWTNYYSSGKVYCILGLSVLISRTCLSDWQWGSCTWCGASRPMLYRIFQWRVHFLKHTLKVQDDYLSFKPSLWSIVPVGVFPPLIYTQSFEGSGEYFTHSQNSCEVLFVYWSIFLFRHDRLISVLITPSFLCKGLLE